MRAFFFLSTFFCVCFPLLLCCFLAIWLFGYLGQRGVFVRFRSDAKSLLQKKLIVGIRIPDGKVSLSRVPFIWPIFIRSRK